MNSRAMHVLLVEDEDLHALFVEKSFRTHEQATLDRVRDGTEAMDYIRRRGEFHNRRRPNLVLLDLQMPRMNGHEVLERLKADDDLKTIPVVVLTTSDAQEDRTEAYRLHANSYVVKPTDFGTFRRMIGALHSYWGEWNRPPLDARA